MDIVSTEDFRKILQERAEQCAGAVHLSTLYQQYQEWIALCHHMAAYVPPNKQAFVLQQTANWLQLILREQDGRDPSFHLSLYRIYHPRQDTAMWTFQKGIWRTDDGHLIALDNQEYPHLHEHQEWIEKHQARGFEITQPAFSRFFRSLKQEQAILTDVTFTKPLDDATSMYLLKKYIQDDHYDDLAKLSEYLCHNGVDVQSVTYCEPMTRAMVNMDRHATLTVNQGEAVPSVLNSRLVGILSGVWSINISNNNVLRRN